MEKRVGGDTRQGVKEAITIIASHKNTKMYSKYNQDLCRVFLNTLNILCALKISLCFGTVFHFPFTYHRSSPKDPEVIFEATTVIAYIQRTFTKYSVDAGKTKTTADNFS